VGSQNTEGKDTRAAFLFLWGGGGGGGIPSTWYGGHCSTDCTSPILYITILLVEQSVECELAGETKYSDKTCPSATLSITNPT
jgi:hypothetical protein